ncbi:hypothetical protein GCM10010168_74340 [Actinoplanes ianthinogenes]|uniref:Uncharacterized protein n=1 Tax=Actinoplanes ianthinogenes TaxID=122358 RepID=A0ABM7LR72_9ACTN|nr:hypothetical protein Aiant_24030 [Actinoplanes ianthinogenes]GGR44648.1 hypothetical protein GCM10010168_74340 [Actinoplanes ianthinogenes]
MGRCEHTIGVSGTSTALGIRSAATGTAGRTPSKERTASGGRDPEPQTPWPGTHTATDHGPLAAAAAGTHGPVAWHADRD